MSTLTPPLDWNDIPILIALAREGSMGKASRRLGVNTSTISRRVAAAESRLQTRLFIRGPAGYQPTDAGRIFLEAADAIEGRIHSLVSATHCEADKVAGVVRITSVDSLLNDWLVPQIGDLLDMHPQLKLSLRADNQALSFTRSEADLALRVARPKADAALVMRRVAKIGMAVFGTRQYQQIPRERWSELPWLTFNEDLMEAAEMKWLRRITAITHSRFRCSDMSGLLQACESGLGVAVLPIIAARKRALVQLSPAPEFHRDLYLLSHRDAGKIRRFRVVADWIAARAQAETAWSG